MKQPNLRVLLPLVLIGFLLAALALFLPRLGRFAASEPGIAQGVAALDAYDYGDARAIFTRLAQQGDSAAKTWLGHMAEEGLGEAPNGTEAVRWYQEAAQAGSPDAQRRLGELYLQGIVVTQDAAQARHWLALSAAQKNVRAERELGELYAQGLGGPRDAARAYGWLAQAASTGDLEAARERDAVGSTLTADAAQAAVARVAADLEKSAPPDAPAAHVAPNVAARAPAAPHPSAAG